MKTSGKARFLIGPLAMLAIVTALIISTCGLFSIEILINMLLCTAILIAWLMAGSSLGRVVIGNEKSLFNSISRIAIGIGLIGLVFQLLGLAGVLNRVSIGLILAAGVIDKLTYLIRLLKKHGLEAHATGWILLALPIAMAVICVSIAPGFLWKPLDPHPYDVMSYHLQIPRQWYDAEKIIPLTHNAFSFFPMLMESHYLAAMHLMGGPWKGMYLCQFITLAHGGLLVCAVAGLLIEFGASRFAAWSAALMTASIPWVFMLSTVCYVEAGVMLYGTLGLGWLILAIREKRSFTTAGFCLGLACGFKYTAFAMTLLPAAGSVILIGLISRNKRWITGAILSFAIAMLVASPWLLRNAVWTNNPVFPLMTSIFGKAYFTDDQVERYQTAHRPPEAEAGATDRIKSGFVRTVTDPQFGYLLIPASVVALLIGLRRFDPAIAIIGLILISTTGVWLYATHVMPRFITPIIPILIITIFLGLESYIKSFKYIFPAICLIQSAFGFVWIHSQLQPTFEIGLQGAFLLPDYSVMEDPAITRARSSNQPVDLIGDAQAFFYVLPSSQLHYRSVFDVNIPPGQSLADGWLGTPVEELRKQGDCVIIRQDELDRLSQTYKKLSTK